MISSNKSEETVEDEQGQTSLTESNVNIHKQNFRVFAKSITRLLRVFLCVFRVGGDLQM